MEINIWAYGSAFDLKHFIEDTSTKHANWLVSGHGIPILNKIFHHLEYYPTEQDQNCLIIVKKITCQKISTTNNQ